MIAVTNDELISPVSTQELADWLKMDDNSDPLLAGLLLSATQCVIDWMQRDLLPRDWSVTYNDWPKPRQGVQLKYGWPGYQDSVDLPYTQLVSVDSVTVYGQAFATEDYLILAGNPAQVRFKNFFSQPITDSPAIVITYRAGFDVIPQSIKTAITMIAAYMHQHAGACDASEAMTKSGAATLLHPYRVRAGLAL